MALLGYSVPETLTDDAGNAMKGITVTVTGPSAYSGTAVSDATTGVLRLGPLPPGDYTVAYGSRSVTVPIVVSLPSGGTSGQVVALSGSTPAWSDPASSGQPLDSDLTAIAALDSTTAGALVTDGSGWIRKTYAQLKTALALTKGDVGLGNVDNTSDVNKPVSTATTAAVAAEATARDAAILAQANIAKGTYAPLDARDTSITSFTVGMLVSSGSSIWRVTTAHAAPFDSTKATQQGGTSVAGVSIPGGWGSVWRAKLAAAPASKPVVACVGTSITRGFYGSNPDTVGYVARLRTALQTAYGDGGSGFRSIGDTAAGTGAWTNYATKPVTLTGTWTQSALTTAHDGPAGCYAVCTTNGGTATFTVRGDTVGVIYIQGPSGVANFSWTVDGVSQGTVTAAATPAQVMRVSASGFGSGTHTVVVTAVGASGAAGTYICGTYGENATGVVVNNFGRSGAQSTVFASASNSFGHPADWSGGASYPCDLLIVELGVNDASTYASGALVTPDTFHANLRAVLEKIKNSGARHGATDVLVLAPHIGLWETEGGAGTALTYHALIARMQEICASYGAAFVNMWANGRNSWDYWNDQSFWGSFATPAAAGTDHVHPSDAGHAAVYTALAAALAA